MKRTINTFFASLLSCCVVTGVAAADEPSDVGRLANINLQDETDQLPADNTAFFTAARKVRVKLDLLAAMQDEAAELDNALVTVVRPSGSTADFIPDSDGMITIDSVEKGPHAIVASGDRVHGTSLYYFDEQPAGEKLAGGDELALGNEPPATTLTLLKIKENDLRDAIDRIRDVDGSMGEVAAMGAVGRRYNYDVTLGPDGTLLGQVILVGNNQQLSPANVNITIYYNGNRVGSTVSDERGAFQIAGLRSGVHGLVASGRPGYAAFAFNASLPSEIATTATTGETLVTSVNQAADVLPCVLVPPEMIQPVVTAITEYYPGMNQPRIDDGIVAPLDGVVGSPIAPLGGGFAPAPFAPGAPLGGGGFGGGGGIAGGGFAGGGLAGLAGLAGVGAVIAATSDDDNAITAPIVASPSSPSPLTN